jgi:adenylate cyclase
MRKVAMRASSLELAMQSSVPPSQRAQLHALVDLYTQEATRYLNFYGPPGAFPMVGYADLLEDAQRGGGPSFARIRGKTAIVGYLDLTTGQRDDHYPTVFSTRDGVKLSGAEILATAISNIETDSTVKDPPPSLRIATAIACGLLLGPALLVASLWRGCVVATILWSGYLLGALLMFRFQNVWLPLLVPLLVQTPAGLVYAIAHNYRDIRRKRDRLRNLFGKFLPDAVIDGLLENQSKLDTVAEPVYGICLVTDCRTLHASGRHDASGAARALLE